jgi:restriction system protein
MLDKMWMVRAGRKGVLIQDFEERGYVGVGWRELGDLSQVKSKEELAELHVKAYPDYKLGKQRMDIGQITRFRFEISKGDQVVSYNSELRLYLVGEIVSDYKYRANSPGGYNHIREVKWLGKVDRDLLSVETKNTVGAIMTLFLLSDSAKQEFDMLLQGKQPEPSSDEGDGKEPGLDDIRKDVMEKAFEFIKDKIQKLDWDEMQELVAGILRAMGYKTRVASAGPDRGTDIVASPDGLGLEQPRIRVEVKHRGATMGASELRSFIGGLRQSDRGLYVSTGGFTKEARYEAERSTIPVTLIDIDELAELLLSNYDNADAETRALMPLIKLYWPA